MPNRVSNRCKAAPAELHHTPTHRLAHLLIRDGVEPETRLARLGIVVTESLLYQVDLGHITPTQFGLQLRVHGFGGGQDRFVAVACGPLGGGCLPDKWMERCCRDTRRVVRTAKAFLHLRVASDAAEQALRRVALCFELVPRIAGVFRLPLRIKPLEDWPYNLGKLDCLFPPAFLSAVT